MFLWRISNHADLEGLGGELLSGRWHTASPGKRIVYLSEHPAVALIENLANLRGDPRFYPLTYQLLRVSISDTDPLKTVQLADRAAPDVSSIGLTQAAGDKWLMASTSVLLRVPSAPSPESWNYLLNPLHPDASFLHIDWARHITYDRRLFHLAS